jgi:PhnB protein
MNSLNVPEGYQAVMPYLILHNAKDFMDWAMNVLDATEKMRSLRDDNSTIAHAELFIGESTIMVAEASEQWTVNNCRACLCMSPMPMRLIPVRWQTVRPVSHL